VPVIVNPIHRTPWREWEAYDEPFSLPAKLYAAGVRFCIAGDGDASNERNVPYHAATAAAYGLPKEEALKAITLNAAKILGLQDRLGSIEPGKDATLIVTTGDPLEITSNVEMEFIRGKKIPLTSRHTRLYEKYMEKYQRLKGSK
jgi:imidazolonepropionase-like amidohydrolase